jgi:hypothetical protein
MRKTLPARRAPAGVCSVKLLGIACTILLALAACANFVWYYNRLCDTRVAVAEQVRVQRPS